MFLRPARERLVETLTAHQLYDLAIQLPKLAWPQAMLQIAQASEQVVGRVGGVPNMPEGASWPIDESGRPMLAWLQLDLSRLPEALELPRTGSLLAFLSRTSLPGPPDRVDCDGGGIMFFDAPPTTAMSPPEGTPILPEHPLTATLQLSLPRSDSVFVCTELSQRAREEEDLWEREWELDPEELPPETPIEERYQAVLDELQPPGSAVAWLLGHTKPCQDDPLLELARSRVAEGKPMEELIPEAQRWDVLLQALGDPSLGYDIMTGGMVYALIAREARRAGKLDDTHWLGQR